MPPQTTSSRQKLSKSSHYQCFVLEAFLSLCLPLAVAGKARTLQNRTDETGTERFIDESIPKGAILVGSNLLMIEFKTYVNLNMKIKSEYPASWSVRNLVRNPGRDFDDVVISSPRIDRDIDKGAIIELSLYPESVFTAIPSSPDEKALKEDVTKTMKEYPCRLGRYEARCLVGMNQLGARICHFIIKRRDARFSLTFIVNPSRMWSDYEVIFDRFRERFEFLENRQ